MRGKSHNASTSISNYREEIAGKTAYIIGADRRVNSMIAYKVLNLIVTPGKEVFILLNPETGKKKRAKNIFIAF